MRSFIANSCLVVALLVLALLVGVQSVAYSADYIAGQLFKLESYRAIGMDEADVYRYAQQTAAYLRGKLVDPNVKVTLAGEESWFLNEREVLHMVDVRHLFQLARYAVGLLSLALLLVGVMAWRRSQLANYLKALSRGSALAILVGILLVLLVNTDFNRYFTLFHLLSFDNDLWLLDPAADQLINLLPEQFFANAAGQAAFRAVGLLLMLSIAGYLASKKRVGGWAGRN
ncbi:MAG: TIGR01906 family membrane protein [Firmicutes bacterium]|nr:TIGR01906 family membrane protein [Bacillota bacterium]